MPGWIADLEAQKERLIAQFSTRAKMVWKISGLAEQPDKDIDGDVNMTEDGEWRFHWRHRSGGLPILINMITLRRQITAQVPMEPGFTAITLGDHGKVHGDSGSKAGVPRD